MGRVRRIAKRFAEKVARSRSITAGRWRVAANKYVGRLVNLAGTGTVAGLAADTVATIVRGTKRASDLVTKENSRAKRRLEMPVIQDPNAAGYQQKKRLRDSAGKKLNKTEKKLKMIGAKMQTYIDRFQGVADQIWTSTSGEQYPGYWPLGYYHNTNSTSEQSVYFPYYLMELNNAFKNRQNGSIMTGCPFMRLIRYNGPTLVDPNFAFENVNGRKRDDDGDIRQWSVERSPPTWDFEWGDKMFIDNYDIRFQLYGARKVPQRLYVQLIQFVDEDLCPPVFASVDDGATAGTVRNTREAVVTEETKKWNNFWISETDRLLGNPINKRGIKVSSPTYEVLYSKIFDFEPVMTTEGDECPHNFQFELKYDYNKVVSFVESGDAGVQITNAELLKGNEWDVNTGNQTSVSCADRGRLFLKICAEAPVNEFNYSSSKIADYFCSFDMIVRRKASKIVI